MAIANGNPRMKDWYWVGRSEDSLLKDAYERSLYTALRDLARGDNFVSASQQTMAEKAKMSKRKVAQLLPKFVEYGLLVRASDEERKERPKQHGYYAPTVLWKLVSVEQPAQEETAASKHTSCACGCEALAEKVKKLVAEGNTRRAAFYLKGAWEKQTNTKIAPGVFIKLLRQYEPLAVVEAVELAATAQVDNRVGYLHGILKKEREQRNKQGVAPVEGMWPVKEWDDVDPDF